MDKLDKIDDNEINMDGGGFSLHTSNFYLLEEVAQIVIHGICRNEDELVHFFLSELLRSFDYTAFKILFMTYLDNINIMNPYFIHVFYNAHKTVRSLKRSHKKTYILDKIKLCGLLGNILIDSKNSKNYTVISRSLLRSNLSSIAELYDKFNIPSYEQFKYNDITDPLIAGTIRIFTNILDDIDKIKSNDQLSDVEYKRIVELFWGYIYSLHNRFTDDSNSDIVVNYLYSSMLFIELINMENLRYEYNIRDHLNGFRGRPMRKDIFTKTTKLHLEYSRSYNMEIVRHISLLIWKVIWLFVETDMKTEYTNANYIRLLYNMVVDKDVTYSENLHRLGLLTANDLLFKMETSFPTYTSDELQTSHGLSEVQFSIYTSFSLNLKNRRKFAVPEWALNYYTMRGRGIDTSNMLVKYASRLVSKPSKPSSPKERRPIKTITHEEFEILKQTLSMSHGAGLNTRTPDDFYDMNKCVNLVENQQDNEHIQNAELSYYKLLIERNVKGKLISEKNLLTTLYIEYLIANGVNAVQDVYDNIKIGKFNVFKNPGHTLLTYDYKENPIDIAENRRFQGAVQQTAIDYSNIEQFINIDSYQKPTSPHVIEHDRGESELHDTTEKDAPKFSGFGPLTLGLQSDIDESEQPDTTEEKGTQKFRGVGQSPLGLQSDIGESEEYTDKDKEEIETGERKRPDTIKEKGTQKFSSFGPFTLGLGLQSDIDESDTTEEKQSDMDDIDMDDILNEILDE